MTASPGAALPGLPDDPGVLKCQCADLWSHPAAQLLIGRSLRPGGSRLTERLLDRAGLAPGSTVLDIGCGPGTTLEMIEAAGHHAVGVDFSSTLAGEAGAGTAPAVVGDAERLPLRAGCSDAAFVECVVSALPDKDAAVSELRRVLRPGGVLVLSDMTLAAAFPEPLTTALAWVACAAGALSITGYAELLEQHDFEVLSTDDRSGDLHAMVARARRRLALFRGASGVGLLPPLEEFVGPELAALGRAMLGHDDLDAGGRQVLAQVSAAVRQGQMGYVAVTARRT